MSETFAEPVAATAFSFLHGASHPAEMVARAQALGMGGIGIADRNSVAGVVRAHVAWKDLGGLGSGFRLIVGARLVFADETPDIVAYPVDRAGWGRLTRLLTLGNRRAEKGECTLHLADLLAHAEGLALIAMDAAADLLARLRAATPHLWLAATMPRAGRDARELARRKTLSAATGVPLVATNDALYATPDCRPLHDVMTCIREGRMVRTAGRLLAPSAERHLKAPAEMARLFAACPQAIAATQDLFATIAFTLDDLRYEYPHEPVPAGHTAQGWLEELVERGGRARFPDGLPATYRAMLDEEFHLIALRGYAPYFLTVHDVVAHARSLDPPILCQGRGSAANSLVCYFLGITPVDPVKEKLLFSRFLSEERDEPPDIDVDFEHERREEVIQYIYQRYGRERAGIVATVIHYRQKSTLREVGKALGLTEDVTARLSGTIWGSRGGKALAESRLTEADGLRRAMATFRRHGTIHHYQTKLVEGMVARGYQRDFAERCFEQIKGFGDYGFPESHAQAFGWLAYVSSWLKCHYPAVFTAALLNSQPMGFYAPAQLVGDARAHGVKVRPIDISASHWDNTLEAEHVLRLGLRQINGFRQEWAQAIVAGRPFADIEDLARRADLPARAMRLLADADALRLLGPNRREAGGSIIRREAGWPITRREAGWDVRRLPPRQLDLFAAMDAPELGAEADPALPPMPLSQEVATDYQVQRLSLRGHPVQFLREALAREGVLSCAQVNAASNGARVACTGAVLVRQRPGKGNAVFITIEDETGIVNALMWARDFEAQRAAVMAARLMQIEGIVQRSKEDVVHLMASRAIDRTMLLDRIAGSDGANPPAPRAPGHPRQARIMPRSRDFH